MALLLFSLLYNLFPSIESRLGLPLVPPKITLALCDTHYDAFLSQTCPFSQCQYDCLIDYYVNTISTNLSTFHLNIEFYVGATMFILEIFVIYAHLRQFSLLISRSMFMLHKCK